MPVSNSDARRAAKKKGANMMENLAHKHGRCPYCGVILEEEARHGYEDLNPVEWRKLNPTAPWEVFDAPVVTDQRPLCRMTK